MTDNRTTELREKLRERGVKMFYSGPNVTYFETPYGEAQATEYEPGVFGVMMKDLTPEQAIAATLGSDEPPYDELLRCLENDGHIRASWDGLRKFWCIELTEEGVRIRDGGTCKMVTSGTACKGNTDKRCTACGAYGIGEHYDGDEHIATPKFCPECGKKVVSE